MSDLRPDDLVWTRKRVREARRTPVGNVIVRLAGVSGVEEGSFLLPDHPALPVVASWLARHGAETLRSILRDASIQCDEAVSVMERRGRRDTPDHRQLGAIEELMAAMQEV